MFVASNCTAELMSRICHPTLWQKAVVKYQGRISEEHEYNNTLTKLGQM